MRSYALSDRKRREVIELCNEGDIALLRAEELMKAHITEVALAEGGELDDAMRQLRAAMRGNDAVAITRKIAALTEASVRLDEFLCKATVTRAIHLAQADKPDQHVCATPDYSEPKTAEVIDTGGPHPQESSATDVFSDETAGEPLSGDAERETQESQGTEQKDDKQDLARPPTKSAKPIEDAALLEEASILGEREVSNAEECKAASRASRKNVFISYSHRDLAHLRRLDVHLRPLEREGIVTRWDDRLIKPGSHWREEIREALRSTKVAVLLISADFLASDFIAKDELPPLLQAAEAEGATVLPVILKPCRFLRMETLSRFQAVNSPARPLIDMSPAQREQLWVRVTEAIELALQT